MANRIKGITIEIGGDTTGLQKALKDVDNVLKDTQGKLKDINKLLKLDPGNTELLRQKQEAYKKSIDETQKRLKTLNDALKQLDGKQGDEVAEQQKNLKREIIATEEALKSLKKEYNDFGSVAKQKLSAVGDSMMAVGDKVADAGGKLSAGVTAPIVAIATMGVNFNAQMEQYQTALTTLTGSADEADRIISQLQEDASKSPFDTQSLIEANSYLLSAGIEADKAREDIMNLGNAIAATGGGSAELSRMAQNLQQIQNTGKATSQDIKQFANAGINIYGLLADATGKTTEQVKDMDVSYEQLSEALAKASEEGGKYYGAMEAQSQTLSGQLSSMKDDIGQLLGEMTAELMPVLKDVLSYIKDFIGYIKNLNPETKKIIKIVAGVAAALGPVLVVVGKLISGAGMLVKAIGFMISPMGAIVAAVTAVIAVGVALYKNWDTIKQKASDLLNSIRNTFNSIKNSIVNAFTSARDAVANVIDRIKSLFNFKWELPKFKTPHITWSLEPIDPSRLLYKILDALGLPTSLPKMSVEWYKKAMQNGMILDSPTIFGAMDGHLLGAGEAGSEVVVGTNSLMEMIRSATQSSGMTINMAVNGSNVSANELADIVMDKLTTTIKRNNQKW